MKINFKGSIEAIFLAIAFTSLLWISWGNLSDHELNHSMPIATLASDNFLHLHYPEYLLQSKDMKYTSVSASSGHRDVLWHYGIILSPLSATFSRFSGLESYDSLLFLVYFFSILGAMFIYFAIRKFNRSIAILSVPLMIFLFSRNFYFIFLWGQYQMLISTFFVLLGIWCFSNIEKKNMYILLAIAVSASFHAHPSETLVLVGFMVAYTIVKLILVRKIYPELIETIKAGVLTFIISFYQILLFKYAYLSQYSSVSFIDISSPLADYLRTAHLSSFGLILIILVIGMIFSLIYSIKKLEPIIAYSFFMLIWGNLNYLGGTLGSKSLPQRFIWPITLSLFLGMGIYSLLKLPKIRLNKIILYAASLIMLFLFISFYYQKMGPQSLLNQDQWNSLEWIRDNTDEKAKILFFYGDVYNQAGILYNTIRDNYNINIEDYKNSVQENKLKKDYQIYNIGEYVWRYPYKKGLFTFGSHVDEMNLTTTMDICSFDYIQLDIQSRVPEFMMFNRNVATEMMRNSFTKVFENGFTVILKNNKVNGECLINRVSQ